MEYRKKDLFDRIMGCRLFRPLEPYYRKYKEGILYLFFGGLTTLVSVGSFAWGNVGLKLEALWANVLSWVLAVTFAYVTNRIWVFQSQVQSIQGILREIMSFFGGRLATLAVEELILFTGIHLLGMNSLAVKITAQFVIVVLNYVVSRLFVFRDRS